MIVPIVTVTLQGLSPDIDRDVAAANQVWGRECDLFLDVVDRITVNRPDLLVLSQDDCSGVGHSVSAEENELFSLGRGRGADVVAYYIERSASSNSTLGCAAHPPGRAGFWLKASHSDPFVLAHELTHVVGRNFHLLDLDNLMFPISPAANPPPDLVPDQCEKIATDRAQFSIESIALNL